MKGEQVVCILQPCKLATL